MRNTDNTKTPILGRGYYYIFGNVTPRCP
jgi:hypothetical protein